ncbi:Clp protease N-terminal domain-containing protein [Sphaerisporangium sp. B11E5]|uniref:Clp protease N-terminal domain-containing protein n=1 Tax=Sphaerisporangium sp. B11E5 TaxID=3153563 RepID=UPI00325C3C92
MFERFRQDARQTVQLAQEETKPFGHDYIGTEHLLLALLRQSDTPPARVLLRHGIDHDRAGDAVARLLAAPDDLDAEALNSIGIDLDAIREKVEATFGPGALDRKPDPTRRRRFLGHIPFTPRAKKVLELSLREAIALKHNYICNSHILLGILREGEGLAAKVLTDAHLDFPTLRQEIKAELN